MNTLRVKIAILLAVVIISVVGVLTGVLLYIFRPPGHHHSIGPVAEQVMMLAQAANATGSGKPAFKLSPTPSTGRFIHRYTDWLNDTLRGRGSNFTATVTRANKDAPLMASVPMGAQGYLTVPVPDLPPPDGGWHVILRWLVLITLGATAISLFVANRMVQPLVLLQKAVASVGPDATLPQLPVQGPLEVKATAIALNSLSSRLKDAVESRMRLVAAAGHDLRTPITRMRLRAEFVPDDEDRAMWFKDIDELERIADSAIQLVREESGDTAAETFRIDELLGEIVGELQGLGLDVSMDGKAKVPAHIRAGRIAISRAFRNLLINSATHGVRSHVSMEMRDAKTLRILIEDEGPGIPDELLGQVFEPFFRVDPARRQAHPGAGLGLSIAREIIARNRGVLKISNGTERGLIQSIELPVVSE